MTDEGNVIALPSCLMVGRWVRVSLPDGRTVIGEIIDAHTGAIRMREKNGAEHVVTYQLAAPQRRTR